MTGGRVILYPPGQPPIERAAEIPPPLAELQMLVGGYIERIPHWDALADGTPCVAYCNENGKLDGLPFNLLATQMWDRAMRQRHGCGCSPDYLAGLVVVLAGPPGFIDADDGGP